MSERMTISVGVDFYDLLVEECSRTGVSVSGFVEGVIEHALDEADDVLVARVKASMSRAAMRSQCRA
jgi:uncharacterized protein (DUF1778 family)